MMKRSLIMYTLAAALFLSAGLAAAAEPQQAYGRQLMTQQEMFEFHERMRYARTPQEREQIRYEHHQQMQARAQAQGFSLPDLPPTNDAYRRMGPGYMGPGYMRRGYMGPGYMRPGYMEPGHMGPGHMGPGYMEPGHMGPGHMGPRYMMPGYMGPGGYRNP